MHIIVVMVCAKNTPRKRINLGEFNPKGQWCCMHCQIVGSFWQFYFTNRGDAGVKTTVIDWEKL